MGKYNKYTKETNWYKNKFSSGGGGGSVGAFVKEEKPAYEPIDLNEFLKAPSTEEISQKQNILLAFEKDYEAITLTIDTDYELYKDYTKQLDDLEEELREAPDDMQFNLNQKYNQIRDEHNILVERLQGNTKKQKEIYEEYTKVGETYDRDIELYNRWATAQNEKQPEPEPELRPEPMSFAQKKHLEEQEVSFLKTTRDPRLQSSSVLDEPSVIGGVLGISQPLDLDKINKYVAAPLKGVTHGIYSTPQAIGGLMRLYGENMEKTEGTPNIFTGDDKKYKDLIDKKMQKPETRLDQFLIDKSQEIIVDNREFLEKKELYPDPDDPVAAWLFQLGSGATSLVGAVGISLLTHSPHAAAVAFGLYQTGGIYQEAREADVETGKATGLAITAGVIEGALEYIGLQWLFTKFGGNFWVDRLLHAGLEGFQEFSQQLGENVVAKLGWDESRSLLRGTAESASIGAVLGAGASVITANVDDSNLKGLTPKEKKGLTESIVGRQLTEVEEMLSRLNPKRIIETLSDPDIQDAILGVVEREALAYKAEEEFPKAERKLTDLKKELTGHMTKERIFLEEIEEAVGQKIDVKKPEDIKIALEFIKKVTEKKEEITPKIEPQEPGKIFEGEAWRAETGITKKETAKEIIDFEAEELENKKVKIDAEKVAKDLGIKLEEVIGEDVVWITKTKKEAERYGEAEKVEITKPNVILATDPDGGFLVLKNVDKYKKVKPGAKEEILKVKPKSYTATVYRGTEEGKAPTDEGLFGKGTYYATDKKYAKTYGKVEKTEVKLANPYIIEGQEEAETFWNEFTRPARAEAIKEGKTSKEADEIASKAARKLLEIKGYDGIVVKDVQFKGEEVVVFHPKKVAPKVKSLEEQLKVSQKEINRLKGIIKTIKGNKEKRQEFKKELVKYIKENMPFTIQNKMISAVKNVSGDKALEKAMEKVDQYTIEHYTRQYTKTITKELKAKRIKPKRMKSGMLKGKFIPAIQDKLDFVRANINNSRAEAQEKIQKNITLFNKGEAINVAEENELLNMVGIKEMDLESLQSTLINIKSLKKEGRTLRAIKVAKDQARHEEDRIKTIETLTGKEVKIDKESGKAMLDSSYRTLPKTKEWGGILARVRKAIDGFNNWQFHWDSLLDKLSALHKTSKPFGSPLSKIGDMVHYARVNNIKSFEEVLDMLQIKFVEAYEAVSTKDVLKITQKLREEIDLGEFENSEGSKVKLVLNKEQIIKKVMQLDDPSLELTFKEGMLYTEEIENALRGALSKKDLAWIEGQREVYDYMWKRINPIFEEMYGIHFPYNPFYSGTIRRDVDLDIPEATLMSQDSMRFQSILNPSLKARSKTKQTLVYDEATNSLMNYVMQMEHFINWAKPLNDLRSIFGDKRVKSTINDLYGRNILTKINGFLDDMTRDGIDKGKIIKWVDTIRFNFTRAILAKPHLGLKQIPSVLAYMTEIPVTDFVKGINDFWKSPLKNYRYLIEHSPYAKERFGEGFERDIHGAMKSDYYHVLAHSHKISDLMMGFVRAGDKFAVMQGMWTVMYSETKGQTRNAGVKKVEDAFVRGAIITDRTQPSFHTESMATGQRSGSLMKLFTMFQTQPNKYYQLIANNARNFKYGRGSRMKAASNIALAWAILPMLFQFIGDGGKWIEKHQLRALILGGANHILVFGAMIRGMYGFLIKEGYDVPASPVFTTLREIEYCLAKIAKWSDPDKDLTPEDIQAFCEHFAKGVGQFLGLPTPYGVQVKKAIESGDYRQLLFSEYILNLGEEKEKKKKPYVKSYGGDKYSKYLKSGYTKKSKYGKYLKY